jgi:hypothetical protein
MFKNFFDHSIGWRDGACSGFLLMESEDSMIKNNRIPLCEIIQVNHSKNIPSLFDQEQTPFSSLIPFKLSDAVIHSGAFTEIAYHEEKDNLSSYYQDCFSLYPYLGNTGTGAIILDIAAGINFINEKRSKVVDCIDRDPYGRESIITIKGC